MQIVYDASDHQVEVKRLITFIFSGLSLLGGVFVVSTIVYIRIYRPLLANRLSLKLTFWIALADIVYSIFVLVLQQKITSNQLCAFLLWGYLEFTLLPIFLTATIAFNLHAIFVSDIYDVVRYQKYYFPFALTLATVISSVPLIAGQFEADPVVGSCWYRGTYTTKTMIWEMCTLFGWVFLVVLYCIFAVCFIGYKLHQHEKYLRSNISVDIQLVNRKTSKAMRRIILYPVVPIVTQTFNCLCEFYTFVHRELYFSLYLLSAVLPACVGLLNAVVFIFDPAVRELLRGSSQRSTSQGGTSEEMSFHLSRPLEGMSLAIGKYPSELPKFTQSLSEPSTLVPTDSALQSSHSSITMSGTPPGYEAQAVATPAQQVTFGENPLPPSPTAVTVPVTPTSHQSNPKPSKPKTKLMSLI
ncbi:hypothetical protein K7432_009662 [Basidiobolus ranarum]|uniref:G-protein coupled receptors family 2 profile 2 domain-containing protein n=1 Tax=Basidiobolus ranarum TaxID=34480 RepID=A0ABR2WPX2_9FUNG